MGNCLKGESDEDDISLLRNEVVDDEVNEMSGSAPQPMHHMSVNQQQRDGHVYHVTPSQRRSAYQLTEEEQVKIAQRMGLIQYLPTSMWDNSFVENKKIRECCICMIDFEDGEQIRYLPCMHYYHVTCIDDWLMRSFTCPTCMEPVDGALLASYSDGAA